MATHRAIFDTGYEAAGIRRARRPWLDAEQEPELLKGLLAGAAAGVVAAAAMTQFQNGWSKLRESLNSSAEVENHRRERPQPSTEDQSEDATMKAAGKLAQLAGTELSHEQKKKAGPFVHYAFGAGMGALYGVAAERAPQVTAAGGTAYGAAVFAVADEIGVPAAGLGPWAPEVPVSTHAYALASHLVYGATLELVRAALRRVL